NETPEFLPKGVVVVHKLASDLEKLRKNGIDWLRADGKTQVIVKDGNVIKILVSTQHSAEVSEEQVRKTLIEKLITPELGELPDKDILINPTGKFVLGGFAADAGLTGRKIMVDTYGGLVPHGGGAFSGKDTTKVDRSAAYMCRFVAKNLVARGLTDKCLVSVSYAIGRVDPLMVEAVDSNGNRIDAVKEFDFRPQAIIERLGLRRPIFRQTSVYGHFGKSGLPWEELQS
ncbi:MAG: methionine adenosyltransferase domain-containing protein, partial [bacterium]|nr:methionine adenosyltransferase domain-containing protein [bacterium]